MGLELLGGYAEAYRNFAARREFLARELAGIGPGGSAEPLVDARAHDARIALRPRPSDDVGEAGRILVREHVARMLADASRSLEGALGATLVVMSGHRRPAVQEACFAEAMARVAAESPGLGGQEAIERAHKLVAYPPVAGHPTGGAVDVTLARGGEPLDMGDPGETAPSGGAPFRIRTFSDGLTGEQASNRMALNLAMALAGFVPFWGEWWHYSYGDREWAAFCGLPDAIYGPVAGP